MGWFDDDSDQAQAHQELQNQPREAKLSHELLAGAASFAAARAYEKHCEENGQPPSHDMAKELLAGFAGAFIDREAETRGMSFVDRERAKRAAVEQNQDQLQQSNSNW